MQYRNKQGGFTIIELIVVLVLVGFVTSSMYIFFNNSFSQYLGLQQESSTYTDLVRQSQRISTVVRTATDISLAEANQLEMYAYFWPNDSYASRIKYYLVDGNTKLVADVTPMSANPPLGAPIESQKKTYTIIDPYYYTSSTDLFVYLDSSGASLTLPITDLYTIKGVKTNVAVPNRTVVPTTTANTISVQVTLRNRKTNL